MIEKIKKDLKKILSEFRYEHCLMVAEEAKKLANHYNQNQEKAYLAGLTHDIAKEFNDTENNYWIKKGNLSTFLLNPKYKNILHADIGSIYVKEKYSLDNIITNAIKYHAIGNINMTTFDKIIFIADKIARKSKNEFLEKERDLAYQNLDQALIFYLEHQKEKLNKKSLTLHPTTTILLNYLKNNKLESITINDNEEYLRQKSQPVELDDFDLKKDIAVLKKYCIEHDVLAIAAIQLGIPKRIIYLKNTNLETIRKIQKNIANKEEKEFNEDRILINPIIKSQEGLTDYWEACASCLDNCGHVKRPYKIKLDYIDINNQKKEDIFEGFEATVISHEIDHLDGILHIDIADKILILNKEERKKFRINHDYHITSKEGNYEDLKNKEFHN